MARSAFQGIVSVEAESDVGGREFRTGRLLCRGRLLCTGRFVICRNIRKQPDCKYTIKTLKHHKKAYI